MLERVSSRKLKEEMRKLFFETIEKRNSTIITAIHSYTGHIPYRNRSYDSTLLGKNKILDIRLKFDTEKPMDLVLHIKNIVNFIIKKNIWAPLFEQAKHVEKKTPEERIVMEPDGTKVHHI
jgi:hypothetical protein